MNEINRRSTLEVMNRIMSHPSTHYFRDNPGLTYNDATGNEVRCDLNSILERIQNNSYETHRQWCDDVEQCWTCAEKNSVEKSGFECANELYLAVYNRSLFQKEIMNGPSHTLNDWTSKVINLREKLSKYMAYPPYDVIKIIHEQSTFSVPKIQVTSNKLNRFIRAVEMLKTDEERSEVYSILSEFQPDLSEGSPDLSFDVTKLSTQTYRALKTYIKAVLEKYGLTYPQ